MHSKTMLNLVPMWLDTHCNPTRRLSRLADLPRAVIMQ
jgi:hypothetical protein